jgi:3-polyprenyl-4-hydroxybenzoate decarboxylase
VLTFPLPLRAIDAPLMNLTNNSAYAIVPESYVFYDQPQVVNSVFVSIVDSNVSLTPYNLSMINNHTVAGPTW